MKKTSLADIAKALNVSKTLVSMVLNNQGDLHGINTETQRKVKEKAKELDYKPNRMARSLRTGKSNTIGLIVTDISNPFYSRVTHTIENLAYQKNHHLIVASSNENPKREEQLIEMMIDRQVDGLIIASTFDKQNLKPLMRLHELNVPFVLIDRYITDFDADMVIGDNEKGAFDLTEHLINKGCKNIALFTITPNHLSSINDRIKGYKAALSVYKNLEEFIYNIPFNEVESSINKILNTILKNNNVDAIITLNNTLASACVKYFKENNVEIPNKIKFASYDNVEWFQYATPTITGMAQPINEIGEKSTALLFSKMDENTIEYSNISLEAKLIERESSK